jgi:hypothetical protein
LHETPIWPSHLPPQFSLPILCAVANIKYRDYSRTRVFTKDGEHFYEESNYIGDPLRDLYPSGKRQDVGRLALQTYNKYIAQRSKLLLISELPFSQDIAGIVKEKLYDCLKIVVQEVRGYSSLNEYSVLNSYTYITTTKDNYATIYCDLQTPLFNTQFSVFESSFSVLIPKNV